MPDLIRHDGDKLIDCLILTQALLFESCFLRVNRLCWLKPVSFYGPPGVDFYYGIFDDHAVKVHGARCRGTDDVALNVESRRMTGAQELLFFRNPRYGAPQVRAAPGDGQESAVGQPCQVKASPGKCRHGPGWKRSDRSGFHECLRGFSTCAIPGGTQKRPHQPDQLCKCGQTQPDPEER